MAKVLTNAVSEWGSPECVTSIKKSWSAILEVARDEGKVVNYL